MYAMDSLASDGQELRRQRQGFDSIEELEQQAVRHARRMSIYESVAQWLAMQRVFESQLRQAAHLFAPERQAAMAELQARLRRLIEPQGSQSGNIADISPGASGSPG